MGHLLQHIEIDRRYMEGKRQELKKYTGLTLNQLTTNIPLGTLTYPTLTWLRFYQASLLN